MNSEYELPLGCFKKSVLDNVPDESGTISCSVNLVLKLKDDIHSQFSIPRLTSYSKDPTLRQEMLPRYEVLGICGIDRSISSY